MLMISVTNGFNRDKYAALENQASHELARAKVVNVLGHGDFLREAAETRKTPGRKAVRAASGGQVDATHDVAEMTHSSRFTAGTAYLFFVHVLDDDLAATSEGVCGRGEGRGEQKADAGQAESRGYSFCLRCTHVLSPGVIVRMSLQNSKTVKSRPS